MNCLCVITFILEYQMGDVSYTYQAFQSLFYKRNIMIANNSLVYIDILNHEASPFRIKDNFIQTRLMDYLYNPDNVTLDYTLFWPNKTVTSNDSNNYYLLYKNKYLGMTFQTFDFVDDLSDSDQSLFNNIYDTLEEALNGTLPPLDYYGFLNVRDCIFHPFSETEKNQYLFEDPTTLSKTLFIPANINKCDALNIAFLENDMIDNSIQAMIANLYFMNPVTQIIFNYQIGFSRKFTYGKNILKKFY